MHAMISEFTEHTRKLILGQCHNLNLNLIHKKDRKGGAQGH